MLRIRSVYRERKEDSRRLRCRLRGQVANFGSSAAAVSRGLYTVKHRANTSVSRTSRAVVPRCLQRGASCRVTLDGSAGRDPRRRWLARFLAENRPKRLPHRSTAGSARAVLVRGRRETARGFRDGSRSRRQGYGID